ncbi:hypothetical protein [Parasitella parasitica]|uniref:Uncharacterized protein n=1 Tax=Parasitella parasitica TaxID=35722 RepID=A0A0B7MXR5_9FUNG|nr:hypothetical protein [Parasitella parasitica]
MRTCAKLGHQGLPDEQYLEALQKHIDNVHAPKSVKDVIHHLFTVLKGCKEREESKANEVSEYNRKILSVYDHYTILEEMYKTEHKAVLKLKDEKAELQARMDEIKSRSEQQASSFIKQLEAQKEESNKLATRQALGRKKIEDRLMAKEHDHRNKLQDMESQNRKLHSEIHSIKNTLKYVLTPQQLAQFTTQQQMIAQQQNQQQ